MDSGGSYTQPSMRVLAIDSGTKSIGVAVCDEMQMTITPLSVMPARGLRHDARAISELAERLNVEAVVVGLPLNMDGTEGAAARRVRRLAQRIRERLGKSVIEWDERLTTHAAKEYLIARGERLRKERLNQIAACLILEDYLTCRRPGARVTDRAL
jgi:putative Holliday junction resolvase